jgi:hypothetical protein
LSIGQLLWFFAWIGATIAHPDRQSLITKQGDHPLAIAPTEVNETQADVQFRLEAFIRLAHADAEHVAGFLKRWLKPLRLGRDTPFPAEFLLELAAIVRIAAWQQAGLAADLGTFPPAQELLENLIRQFLADPMSFELEAPAVRRGLGSQVVSTWIARCAWKGPSETGADVWLGEIDEGLLLELMADFLYEIRNLPIED